MRNLRYYRDEEFPVRVARRMTGTWTRSERRAIERHMRSDRELTVPHDARYPQFLIVLRGCPERRIASAISGAARERIPPVRIRNPGRLFASRMLVGIRRLEDGSVDTGDLILRFVEAMHEPLPLPRDLYTKVMVERPEAWGEDELRRLKERLMGLGGRFVELRRFPARPDTFAILGRYSAGYLDGPIRGITGEGVAFRASFVRSQAPERAFGPCA